jgi:hypothetical protein
MSRYVEAALLDALFNNASPAALQLSNRYVKLHTGAPGVNGTSNAAGETTRKAVTGAASSGGVFTSVADLIWTSVASSETYTDISIWDSSTAGNCLWVGSLSGGVAVTSGGTFTIAAGNLTVTAL